MNQQLLFNSSDQSEQTFANFFIANNDQVCIDLKDYVANNKIDSLFIYGPAGSGKTHLLKSVINAYTKHADYVDLSESIADVDSTITANPTKLWALDNFDSTKNSASKRFSLVESIRQQSGKLVISSKLAPNAIDLQLPDLTSRIVSGRVYALKMMNDTQKLQALKFRAQKRGIFLDDNVCHYLINRYPRDLHSLFSLLNVLDDGSLVDQRRITIPFIKGILEQD